LYFGSRLEFSLFQRECENCICLASTPIFAFAPAGDVAEPINRKVSFGNESNESKVR
jgi:hypothetical protein